jgi:hypothetical protein
VDVLVGVLVAVGVKVAVPVGVLVCIGVNVAVPVGVSVIVSVLVGDCVRESVGVADGVSHNPLLPKMAERERWSRKTKNVLPCRSCSQSVQGNIGCHSSPSHQYRFRSSSFSM